jgi:hypothetical protein
MSEQDAREQQGGDNDEVGEYWDDGCNTCGGNGFIVICIDDLRRGAGECMHGDGEILCPECKGDSAW